jgi:hypothetical protein
MCKVEHQAISQRESAMVAIEGKNQAHRRIIRMPIRKICGFDQLGNKPRELHGTEAVCGNPHGSTQHACGSVRLRVHDLSALL